MNSKFWSRKVCSSTCASGSRMPTYDMDLDPLFLSSSVHLEPEIWLHLRPEMQMQNIKWINFHTLGQQHSCGCYQQHTYRKITKTASYSRTHTPIVTHQLCALSIIKIYRRIIRCVASFDRIQHTAPPSVARPVHTQQQQSLGHLRTISTFAWMRVYDLRGRNIHCSQQIIIISRSGSMGATSSQHGEKN